MRRFWRLAIVAIGLASSAAAAPAPRIEYTFAPVFADSALRAVQIDVRFRGEADGETGLRLPESWGGQDELWRGIETLEAVAGAQLVEAGNPARRTLRHAPDARIHLRYRVIQDWQGEPRAAQGNPYRPIIQPGYFHLIGDAALVIPEIDGATILRVRARGFPRDWSFASDLQHGPLILARANSSITIGGDYRLIHAQDRNVRVAIRGAWGFSDTAFAAETNTILRAQRRFWGDASSPYLVTLTQLSAPDPGWTSIGGTGLGDAFAFFATPNGQSGPMTRTLAHEGLHTWIPGQIGGAPEENEALQYWLSEGFTDFFTGRLLVRDGVWTPAQFAADLNDMLAAYARSSVRTAPNTRVLADFWNDREVQQLPYQRGRLLATIWDARLRAAGAHDFDDVILAMRDRARAGDTLDAVAMFPLVIGGLGVDVGADVARFADAGAPILLPADVFAPCGAIETREVPEFHRGFDIEATQANGDVIAGVVHDGPAYAAGMRDGMVLLRRDGGQIGDAEQEIAYIVRDGGGERTIRYMPRGRGSFTRQRLVLADDLVGERLGRCVSVLGGA